MSKKFFNFSAMAIGLLLSAPILAEMPAKQAIYLDADQPLQKRVEDLLARMTIKEKVGQLNIPLILPAATWERMKGEVPDRSRAPSTFKEREKFVEGTFTNEIGPGSGVFLINSELPVSAGEQAKYFNGLQAIALKKTRLGIPLLNETSGTHGATLPGATVFPEGLAIGSTWNVDLVKDIYAAAAREARAVGVHQLDTLVIEPNRDPRLGRNAEGYGEDPYLLSRIAESIVGGVQGDGVAADDKAIAVLSHYPGQSQPASGMERGAMQISERALREVFLPPWVAGIRKAGALGVMATYPEIDGIPVHSSEKILTTILRDELGFKGLVMSEGDGFATLLYEGIVATQKEAGALALDAGVDVNITYEPAYLQPLIDNVQEGRVSGKLLDRAVRRVLEQKFRLGLFDHPYVDSHRAAQVVNSSTHKDLALRSAREGIVLLKNDKNLLPLDRNLKSIAVIGRNANDPGNQLGDYVVSPVTQAIVTVLDGIKKKLAPGAKIDFARGADITGTDRGGFQEAIHLAQEADIAVVVVGEQSDLFNAAARKTDRLTVGETADVANLDLTGVQEDLVKAVIETGTPTVVVLINGRPLSTRWISENVPAIVEAWFPGERGGDAVADVLFGDYNPSGRLPITIPRHVGQLPVYYNYQPSKAYWMKQGGYVDMPSTPLYEFGYGLSYTTFEYGNLRITPRETHSSGNVQVDVDIRNTGVREGIETPQLYIRDVIGSVSTPVKQLRGFQKLALQPGETRTASFTLTPDDLALLNRDMHWVVEPGAFEVMLGASSEDIRLRGTLLVKE